MALDLGKQVGPLPVGGWIGVVGGALVIAYFVNKGQANADAASSQLTESGTGTGGGQFIYEPPAKGETPLEENDNNAWGRKATNWLIGRGNSPGLADNAIRKYLSSEELSSQEQALVDQALVEFGAPPEPLAPVRQIENPPEAPDRLKSASIWRLNQINGIVLNVADQVGPNNGTTRVDLSIAGSQGYRFNVSIPTSIPGVTYRYEHYAPPKYKTESYTYTLTPLNGDLAGPSIKVSGVKFAKIGQRLPSVNFK